MLDNSDDIQVYRLDSVASTAAVVVVVAAVVVEETLVGYQHWNFDSTTMPSSVVGATIPEPLTFGLEHRCFVGYTPNVTDPSSLNHVVAIVGIE